MRLTLRTLLAYLDDTLEPVQAKVIGQKLAESESAQELVERIKQVTRRRRLTTPSSSGPGGIDPNTIAEYLDNAVTPEQANEVEEICLASDVHLAEVSACHQILTLILGEPSNVPASASQRMVELVKGPEAIAHRKAAGNLRSDSEGHFEPREIDETLRLGLPPVGRKDSWTNRLLLIGGGLAAACLLVFALFQMLHTSDDRDPNKDKIVQVNPDKDKIVDDKKPADKDEVKIPDKKADSEKKESDKKDGETVKDKKDSVVKDKVVEIPGHGETPIAAPNDRQAPIGHMIALDTFGFDKKEQSVLLQLNPAKNEWKRILPKENASEVISARPLLALPGVRGQVMLNKGVRLFLWGAMPEQIQAQGIHESLVEIYTHETLDADLTFYRGRVLLTSSREEPVTIRLRFENPTQPARPEFVDITLQAKGSSILVDRISEFPLMEFPPLVMNEPFYPDPKSTNRAGPTVTLAFNVVAGTVSVKFGDITHTLNPPPGPFQLLWNSRQGMAGPMQKAELPRHLLLDPPLPPNADEKVRKDFARARNNMVEQLSKKALDVVLAETLKSSDQAARRLAIYGYAATDDLTSLVEAMENPNPAQIDLRQNSRDALRNWIAASRDNDYKLFDVLNKKYKKKEAVIIMELLHGFSHAELKRPERYELLIEYLTSNNQMIRELSSWHLYAQAPAGRAIIYNSAADSDVRHAAAAAWRALVPAGHLPPLTAPMKK